MPARLCHSRPYRYGQTGGDPQEQFASPFSYAGNNPVMYNDPDGEFGLLASTLIGAAINGAGYAASTAFSDGGFNNWNGGQFWKSVGVGAISGAVSYGIGEAVSSMKLSSFGQATTGAFMHGLSGGIISGLTGGDPYSSFATGLSSSFASSGLQALKINSTGSIVFGAALTGGLAAQATGGDFWSGAAQGAIVGGLNHAAHGGLKRNPPWYKTLARIMNKYELPDAVSFAGNIDLVVAGGSDFSPSEELNRLFILRGKNIGQNASFVDIGIAVGFDVGASLVITKYYYTGNINTLTLNDFDGFRYSATLGVSGGVEIGGGISLAPIQHGGYIIGIATHIGVSPPGISGNVNSGFTRLKNKK